MCRLNGAHACSLPVKLIGRPVPFDFGELVENSMLDRHRTWLKIVNARYKERYRARARAGG